MTTAARLQAAGGVVRRLNAAVKSRRLYGQGHALRTQTVSAFVAGVAAYHERFGSFVLETHRDGLIVEGQPFDAGESVHNLALHLYAMGIWQLVITPGLTEDEVEQLLEVVALEREEVLAAGGFVPLLAARNISHVRVVELTPGEEDVAQITPQLFQELVEGRLTAANQAMLLGLLRAGPEQAARLVGVVVERAKQAFPEARGDELAGRIYEALAALDRLIADTPPGESQDLLKALATAVSDLEDPTDGAVPRTILGAAAEDLSARALLAAMTSEQIARMVIPCLEAGEPPPQLGQLVQGLPFDPDKVRETLALISQRTGQSFDIPALLEEISVPGWIRNFPQDLVDFRITADDAAVTEEEIQALAAEARTDEAWVAREHLQMLVHLVAAEEDPAERQGALDLLVTLAVRRLREGEVDPVSLVLRGLEGLTGESSPAAEAARTALRSLLSHLPEALSVREVWAWADDHPLLVSLRAVARPAAAALVQLLPQEHDPSRRQVLIAMAARLGDPAVDLLASRLNDPNPEQVRPVIQALGQMRTVPAVHALRAAAAHPAVAVRREAMDALRASQLVQAQETLVAFLRDPDPEVRRHCIGQLTPETVRRTTRDLVAMLAAPDLARAPEVRLAVCEALVRGRAVEAIPELRRHGSPFKLRAADRDVARQVRAAVAALERMQPPPAAAQRRAAS